jgi:hypothetical protein
MAHVPMTKTLALVRHLFDHITMTGRRDLAA